MLSSSILCKNKEVLDRNGGWKWKLFISCVGSMSLLNMTLVWNSCRFGDIQFVNFPPWVWVIYFDLSSALFHVTITSDPVISNISKSRVVSLICTREVSVCSFRPPSDPLFGPDSLSSYSSVSCRCCGKHYGPPLTKSLPVNFNSLSRKLI